MDRAVSYSLQIKSSSNGLRRHADAGHSSGSFVAVWCLLGSSTATANTAQQSRGLPQSRRVVPGHAAWRRHVGTLPWCARLARVLSVKTGCPHLSCKKPRTMGTKAEPSSLRLPMPSDPNDKSHSACYPRATHSSHCQPSRARAD